MFKLNLKKAEEPDPMPISIGSFKKQKNSRKTSASLTMLKPFTVWITTNWKILKEMGIPDHLTYLLRNLYAGQEATESDMKQQTNFKLGKEYMKAVYCHPAYLYVEYIMPNARLNEAETGIKIARRNTNNLRYGDDTTFFNGRK